MEQRSSSVNIARAQDGSRIAHRSRGRGDVLVFARGWITHLDLTDLDPSIRAFFHRLEQQFRVVRYDGRGNGLSERSLPEDLSLTHLVDDLAAVIDANTDSPIVLWGSSWAGPIAIQYAATHPDRVDKLVLDGTFAAGAALASPQRAESFLALLATARSQPEAVYASMSYMTDPEPKLSHTLRIERVRASIGPDELLALYSLLYKIDVRMYLEQIICPTLVIHRRGSRAVPASASRELVEGMSDVEMAEIEGEAHNLWEGDSRPVFAILADFLRRPGLVSQGSEAIPVRVVSLLVVDQVSSTAQMRRLGDDKGGEVQARMIQLLHDATSPFGAEPLADTGDGMVFLLQTASDAVSAAQLIMRSLISHNEGVSDRESVHLRIGVHSGEVHTSDGGRTHGIAIAFASRLCDLAGSGQILVSESTFEEASLTIGEDSFKKLGSVELKGIGRTVPYDVKW